jgi:hypothetical protein
VKKLVSLLFVLVLFLETAAWAGLGSGQTMYVGGTTKGVAERTEGKSSMGEDGFIFTHKGGKLTIAYAQVNGLEYGQKAGRRVGMAIAISPLLLFSKKRRHYLTISYLDDLKQQQAAVFELGKDAIKPTLSGLEAKTNKKVEYQDEEARKSAGGNN